MSTENNTAIKNNPHRNPSDICVETFPKPRELEVVSNILEVYQLLTLDTTAPYFFEYFL